MTRIKCTALKQNNACMKLHVHVCELCVHVHLKYLLKVTRRKWYASLLQKVITPKGRFSENTFMVMFDTNLRIFNARNLLRCHRRVFVPCQDLTIAADKTRKFQLQAELSPGLWRRDWKNNGFFYLWANFLTFSWWDRFLVWQARFCAFSRTFHSRWENTKIPIMSWVNYREDTPFLASSFVRFILTVAGPGGWHNVLQDYHLSLILLAIVHLDGNRTISSCPLLDARLLFEVISLP